MYERKEGDRVISTNEHFFSQVEEERQKVNDEKRVYEMSLEFYRHKKGPKHLKAGDIPRGPFEMPEETKTYQ